MDQKNFQQAAREEDVGKLRAEIESVRNKLNTDVLELKSRIHLDAHTLMEKSVQVVAGSAGTVVGSSIAFARKFFAKKSG